MLVQQNMFAIDKSPDIIAIERLRQFEPPEGYYLAFSGGKDSIVILDLVIRAGVKFDAHYNLTTVDPPELVRHVKTFPEVIIEKPEITMWQLIPKKLMPPTRIVRYCCEVLKERGGEGRVVVTGVRWAESVKRAKRRVVESCWKGGNKRYVNPIIDWTDSQVWEYIFERNLRYCKLYDEGFKRLGCIMCPMQGTKGMLRDAERWPKYYQAYLRAFERMLERKRRRDDFQTIQWHTAKDVMDWWIYNPPRGNPDQTILFE